MHESLEKDVAVDGPVANAGARHSSRLSTGRGPLVGSLERVRRRRRKREAVLRLPRGAPVARLSRGLPNGGRRGCQMESPYHSLSGPSPPSPNTQLTVLE